MAKKDKWVVEVDGVQHTIEYKAFFRVKLIVDGKEEILKSNNPIMILIDKVIKLGSKEVHFVIMGSKADLAVDGVYLNSKKEYVPLEKIPKWTWIFVGACIIPEIITLGGALVMVIVAAGAMFCIKNSITAGRSTTTKIIINVALTIMVWVLVMVIVWLAVLARS